MKRLAMLIITLTVGASTPTIVNVDGDNYFAIIPKTCQDDLIPSTPTVSVPVVTTGPYTMRVSTQPNSDCYSIPYVNPNGTCAAGKWVACPK